MKEKEVKELISLLNKANDAYYNGEEIMSNKEYDDYMDSLIAWERETGIVFPDSPTQSVGSKIRKGKEVIHEFKALSLDKTKNKEELCSFFIELGKERGKDNVVLMWKLDGSTLVLTYDNGKLTRAATRGNGEIGQNITQNAPFIKGIPMTIPDKEHTVIRGECLMSYTDFNEINEGLSIEDRYKNPRNLANGSVTMDNPEAVKERRLMFKAFKFVAGNKEKSFTGNLKKLYSYGFDVVDYLSVSAKDLSTAMDDMSSVVEDIDFPVDGLVIAYDDEEYSDNAPLTNSKYPNKSVGYAFKWADEAALTTLEKIEWSASRTGLINPVAVFTPVELEGTTVSRATLNNVSFILGMDLKWGDSIKVIKANKIIPQIIENVSRSEWVNDDFITEGKIERYRLPDRCPVCNGKITYKRGSNTEDLSGTIFAVCENESCSAKTVHKIIHFCERDCMNIKGVGESVATFLVDKDFITSFVDLLRLPDEFNEKGTIYNIWNEDITSFEGWSHISVSNLIDEIEKAKNTTFIRLVHALSIPNIGLGQAKLLAPVVSKSNKENESLIETLMRMVRENFDFTTIDGIGEVLSASLVKWCKENAGTVSILLNYLSFADKNEDYVKKEGSLSGLTFVVTGNVTHFKNRAELQNKIEELGGKNADSVSKNTSYLINNDVTSTSGKNKKAKELGIPIISEEDFLALIN